MKLNPIQFQLARDFAHVLKAIAIGTNKDRTSFALMDLMDAGLIAYAEELHHSAGWYLLDPGNAAYVSNAAREAEKEAEQYEKASFGAGTASVSTRLSELAHQYRRRASDVRYGTVIP